jgi:hypothetical protein
MEKRWIKAATILPPTIKVAGIRLLPFCLRHRIALEALDSPVLDTTKAVGPSDLILAVRVLSTHNFEDIRRPWSMGEQFRIALYNHSPARFIAELRKLVIYFEAQSLWPRLWQKDEKPKSVSIPWQLTAVASLVRNGCDLEAAWTMPEAEAIWLYFANCKAEGASVEIISDEEWSAMERHKLAEAQKKTPDLAPDNPRTN